MDQLIELLQQIQELAGVAIDALKDATGDTAGATAPEGAPPEGGGGGGGGGGAPAGPPPERS